VNVAGNFYNSQREDGLMHGMMTVNDGLADIVSWNSIAKC
jgi:hypothetical protein